MATLVQSAFSSPAATPATQAYTSNVTAGNMLFVFVIPAIGTTPTVSSITDTIGNTWSKLDSQLTPDYDMEVWTAVNASTAANTVTVNYSGAPASSGLLCVGEVSGQTAPTVGPHATQNNTVASTTQQGAQVTTTRSGIVLCGFRFGGSPGAMSWTAPFADLANGSRSRLGYHLTSGAAENPTATTLSITSESATMTIYDDAAAGGGGGVTVRQYRMGLMGVQ